MPKTKHPDKDDYWAYDVVKILAAKRRTKKETHEKDFFTGGSMHCFFSTCTGLPAVPDVELSFTG